ncbi:MAG: hypothetical protein ACXWUG_23800 [Polyangiales bacterium]
MKTISMILAFAVTSAFGGLAYTGCSSDSGGPAATNDTGTTGGSCELTDPMNPPIDCSPELGGATKCTNTTKVDSCPSNTCMSVVDQTGDVKNFRMGRIRLWQPQALLSLTSIAVDPGVNPACFNGGTEAFTWLIQLDTKNNKIKTGGSRASKDGGKTFSFLSEVADASKLEGVCPGFKGPTTPIDLSAVESTVTGDATTGYNTPVIPKINVPIFDATTGVPIILPLSDAFMKGIKVNGSCIGSWDKTYWCDGDSLGWTTGGAIVAKITAEEADHVPVKSAGCQSLCAILVNDATKTEKGVCKRGADGKIPEIGDSCVGGTSCKNAFVLSATFGAYGVNISGSVTPPDDGGTTDTGSSDTGSGDTGAATDAASGG